MATTKRHKVGRSLRSAHKIPGSNATLADLRRVPRLEWEAAPTLSSGHTDNLKYESPRYRVWSSRMTLADYDGDRKAFNDERLVIEENKNGRWERA